MKKDENLVRKKCCELLYGMRAFYKEFPPSAGHLLRFTSIQVEKLENEFFDKSVVRK